MSDQNKRIAVVDDEFEIVELIKAVLRSKGHDILVAYDGEEGLELVTREKPDLIITDLRMPKMSGMEFCKRVRRISEIADTPILVISSVTGGSDMPEEYWAAGLKSDDFLPKPFDPLSLLGRVEYLLRKKGYVSSRAEGNSQWAQQDAEGGHREIDGPDGPPDEVVRTFVESWNNCDFAREYDTLGEEMAGSLSREDYVQRRMQLYADEQGEETKHLVLDTDVTITRNVATVACLREDLHNGVPRRKDERYTLKKTNQGWKIVSVRSRPVTFAIE